MWWCQRVFRIRVSKNRQHNGQRKRTKGQTTIHKPYNKTKEWVTRTPLKTEDVHLLLPNTDHLQVKIMSEVSHDNWKRLNLFTRLTWPVPLVEQELLTLPEHLSSSSVFSGVRVIYYCWIWISPLYTLCLSENNR
jgi:hypothetical protein